MILNCDQNCVKHFAVLSDTGKLFQRIGDATAKHRSPCVTVLDVGTNYSSVDEPDLSVLVTPCGVIVALSSSRGAVSPVVGRTLCTPAARVRVPG